MCLLRRVFQSETRLSSECKDVWQLRKVKLLEFLDTNYKLRILTATCISRLKAEHMKCSSFSGKYVTTLATAVSTNGGAVSLLVDSDFSDRSVFILRAWHLLRASALVGKEVEVVSILYNESEKVWLEVD